MHSALEDLPTLERARRQVLRFRFEAPLEAAFRERMRRQYVWPRAILFSLVALGFALLPFYEAAVFAPQPDFVATLRWVTYALVLPGCLAVVGGVLLRIPAGWRQALQTFGVLAYWCGAVGLHIAAIGGALNYPVTMVGIALISVAVFGGYAFRRLAVGIVIAVGVVALAQVRMNTDRVDMAFSLYSLTLITLIALFGAFVIEMLARISWVSVRYAQILSRTDALTGLANRRSFTQDFERLLRHTAREQRPFGLCLFDLDHFKKINDTHGHPTGDEVLRLVGGVLRHLSGRRALDLSARYGGEEFVLVFYDLSEASFQKLLERIQDAIRALAVPLETGGLLHVTASFGALYVPAGYNRSHADLLRRADELLYQAKANGRDRIELASLASLTGMQVAAHGAVWRELEKVPG